jgi:hypothetical protein
MLTDTQKAPRQRGIHQCRATSGGAAAILRTALTEMNPAPIARLALAASLKAWPRAGTGTACHYHSAPVRRPGRRRVGCLGGR